MRKLSGSTHSSICKIRADALSRLLKQTLLLIKEWVTNPTMHLHCNKLHANELLDCNRPDGKFLKAVNKDN